MWNFKKNKCKVSSKASLHLCGRGCSENPKFDLFLKYFKEPETSGHPPNSQFHETGQGHGLLACTQHHIRTQASVSNTVSGNPKSCSNSDKGSFGCYDILNCHKAVNSVIITVKYVIVFHFSKPFLCD